MGKDIISYDNIGSTPPSSECPKCGKKTLIQAPGQYSIKCECLSCGYTKKIERPACYVATWIYGSYSHPSVNILRNFRDNYLSKNISGRLFIWLYYRVSPKLLWISIKLHLPTYPIQWVLDRIVEVLKHLRLQTK